jgi:tight adherence protein C
MISALSIEVAAGFSLALLGAGAYLMRGSSNERRVDDRLSALAAGTLGRPTAATAAAKVRPGDAVKVIAGLGQSVLKSGIVSGQTVEAVQRSLEGAGIRNRNALGAFVAAKLMLAVGVPLVLFIVLHRFQMAGMMRNVLIGGGAVAGLLAPDYFVRSLRKRYQHNIASGLPDALDMLVMCAESGLSLEPAMQRVGAEIHQAHPAIGSEIQLTCSEFQISPDSHAVLEHFSERTGVPEVRRVVATLQQTLQYGTPLAEALRVLSAEMRQEMLTRFEEKAAKLPVLLTLPMILFILPTLFMIVGGPAVIQAMHIFSNR